MRPCRSCGAQVIDLLHEGTRKPAPIDVMPVARGGNVEVDHQEGTYRIVGPAERARRLRTGETVPLHLNHWATCPQAKAWRERRSYARRA